MDTIFVVKALKKAVREAKWTYRDLSAELNLSEAGVKKLFSKRNISIQRVFDICGLLNISLTDLLADAEVAAKDFTRFSPSQTSFFAKNLNYFHYFMRLAYEQQSPNQIQDEFKLSSRSTQRYLKKLEDLGLIVRHSQTRIQILGGVPLAVNTQGTELEFVKMQSAGELLNTIRASKVGNIAGGIFYLTELESQDLENDLAKMLTNYSIISNRNRKDKKGKASSTESLMFMRAPYSLFNQISDI